MMSKMCDFQVDFPVRIRSDEREQVRLGSSGMFARDVLYCPLSKAWGPTVTGTSYETFSAKDP
eukprot:1727899-Alexandrium_andersonii.AAC.1